MSDAILSCAVAPLRRAGKSVQRMAGHLNKLEGALSTEADDESQRLAKKFGLVGGDKGGLRSRLLKTTLTAAITSRQAHKNLADKIDFANIDKAPEERERGITLATAHVESHTDAQHTAQRDCPGHPD